MSSRRSITLCGVLVLLAILIGAGAIGGMGGITAASADNETTLHEHPDEVDSEGDLGAVEGWLSGRMGEIHLDCATGVEIGAYDACDRLDEDYPDFLSRYATVKRDIDGDDETAGTFEETRDTQREFADADETFWETYEEYEQARESDEDERRRQAARDLLEIAAETDQRSESLTALFSQLEAQTGLDLGDAIDAVERSNEEIQETAAVVETEEFIETELTVEGNATTASFTDPVELSGQLIGENGETVSNARVVLVVDDRRIETATTAEEGRYELTYRPTATPTGETELRVAYDPPVESPYLGSEASTRVDVHSVEATVEFVEIPETVAYNEPIRVTGLVTVDRPASGVDVVGTLGAFGLGDDRTDAGGEFGLSTRLSSDVPDGERTLEIRASEPGLALEPVKIRTTVTVVETETELSVNGTYDDGSVRLEGRLVTVDGDPVAGQTITGSVDGIEETVATTDADGRYSMAVNTEAADGNELNLSVAYSGSETNLGASRAETTVQIPQTTPSGLSAAVGGILERGTETVSGLVSQAVDRPFVAAIIALAVVVILAAAVLALRLGRSHPIVQSASRRVRGRTAALVESIRQSFTLLWNAVSAVVLTRLLSRLSRRDEVEASTETPTQPVSDDPEPTPVPSRTEQLFETAQQRLQDGFSTEAVTLGYASVREQFQTDSPIEVTQAQTHREFYRDITNVLPDEKKAALRTVTDAYEQAAFAPVEIDEATAEDALRAVRLCLDGSSEAP